MTFSSPSQLVTGPSLLIRTAKTLPYRPFFSLLNPPKSGKYIKPSLAYTTKGPPLIAHMPTHSLGSTSTHLKLKGIPLHPTNYVPPFLPGKGNVTTSPSYTDSPTPPLSVHTPSSSGSSTTSTCLQNYTNATTFTTFLPILPPGTRQCACPSFGNTSHPTKAGYPFSIIQLETISISGSHNSPPHTPLDPPF